MRDVVEALVQAAWSSPQWADSVAVRDRLRQTLWHQGRVYSGRERGRGGEGEKGRTEEGEKGRKGEGEKEADLSPPLPFSPSPLLLFGPEGNRSHHTGEHVVWLQPMRENGRNLAQATLSVWRMARGIDGNLSWKRVRELIVKYNQTNVGTP